MRLPWAHEEQTRDFQQKQFFLFWFECIRPLFVCIQSEFHVMRSPWFLITLTCETWRHFLGWLTRSLSEIYFQFRLSFTQNEVTKLPEVYLELDVIFPYYRKYTCLPVLVKIGSVKDAGKYIARFKTQEVLSAVHLVNQIEFPDVQRVRPFSIKPHFFGL